MHILCMFGLLCGIRLIEWHNDLQIMLKPAVKVLLINYVLTCTGQNIANTCSKYFLRKESFDQWLYKTACRKMFLNFVFVFVYIARIYFLFSQMKEVN